MTVVVKVQLKDLGKYEAKLAASFRPTIRKAMVEASKDAIAHIRAVSMAMVRPYKETYYRAWKAEQIDWGTTSIRNESPHAMVIEYGRRAGARPPPLAPIAAWLKFRMGMPAQRDGAGRAKAFDYRRLAFLVARAIGRRGLPAKHVMDVALWGAVDRFQAAMVRALDKALRETR